MEQLRSYHGLALDLHPFTPHRRVVALRLLPSLSPLFTLTFSSPSVRSISVGRRGALGVSRQTLRTWPGETVASHLEDTFVSFIGLGECLFILHKPLEFLRQKRLPALIGLQMCVQQGPNGTAAVEGTDRSRRCETRDVDAGQPRVAERAPKGFLPPTSQPEGSASRVSGRPTPEAT